MEIGRSDIASEAARVFTRRVALQRAAAGSLAFSAVGLLEACGGSDDDSNSGTGDLSGTISYIKGPFSDVDLKIQRDLAGAFETDFPDITVTPQIYPWESRESQLSTAYAGNNPPDIAYMGDAIWVGFAEAGALVDLGDRVNADDFGETFEATPERFWDGASHNDVIYGVPVYTANSVRIINRDLMRRAGVEDWSSSTESMRQAAAAVKGETGQWGFQTPTQSTDFNNYGPLLAYVWSAGGEVFNEDLTELTLDTTEVAEQFDRLAGIYQDDSAPRPGLYDGAGAQALFQAGKLAMLDTFTNLTFSITEGIDFDWELQPQAPAPGNQPSSYGAVGQLSIASKSEAQDAAWEYIRYLTSLPTLETYLRQFPDLFAARTDVGSGYTGDSEAGEAVYAAYQELSEIGRPVPPHPQFPALAEVLGEEFEQLLLLKQDGAETAANMVSRGAAVIGS